MQYTLPIAYQKMGTTTLVEPMNDIISTSFVDESALSKKVNDHIPFSFIQVNDDIDEAEEDKGGEKGKLDDRNETDEEQGDIHLYDDDDDENDDEDGVEDDDEHDEDDADN